jgi:hypothetical protein
MATASTYMVRQVCVHDNHKISCAEIEAMDVRRSARRSASSKVSQDGSQRECVPESKFPCARFKDDLVLAVGGSQLPCNILRAIWAVVVDDNHLPGEVTILHHTSAVPALARGTPRSRSKLTHAPFAENFGEKPYDDREVFALFVSGEDYGVFVSTMLALHSVALERVHCRRSIVAPSFVMLQ